MSFNWIGKSSDGRTVILNKFCHEMFSFNEYELASNSIGIGAVVDIETTGLDKQNDKIIEIGVRLFQFHRTTAEILNLGVSYSEFEDPQIPLSDEIKSLTGISNEMLKGRKIDWDVVNTLLSECSIVIAHNSSFDRHFIDKHSEVSKNKIWGCSLTQVDWKSCGFNSNKLDVLSIYHGFFTDSHRALNDVDALVYLLSLKKHGSSIPYLFELIKNAQKNSVLVKALGAPFDKKDLLKLRKYQWDNLNKVWIKEIYQDDVDLERKWLEENIYPGKFLGEIKLIDSINRFKTSEH